MKVTTVAEQSFDTKLDVPTTVFLSGGLKYGIPIDDFISAIDAIAGAALKVQRALDFDDILVSCTLTGNSGFVTGTKKMETGL